MAKVKVMQCVCCQKYDNDLNERGECIDCEDTRGQAGELYNENDRNWDEYQDSLHGRFDDDMWMLDEDPIFWEDDWYPELDEPDDRDEEPIDAALVLGL